MQAPRNAISCAVIVSTRNRAEILAQTLSAVAKVDVPAGCRAELVVVDNGSSDMTPQLASCVELGGAPGRMIRVDRPGVARARNAGAAATTGDVLLFLDDDVRPPREWLQAMLQPIRDGADAVAGLFRLLEEEPDPSLTDEQRRRLVADHSIEIDSPFLASGNMAVRRDVFDHLGGFEEELGPGALGAGGEDLLLTYRIQATAGKIAVVESPRCEHWIPAGRVSRSYLRRRAAAAARSEAWLAYHWFHRTDRAATLKALILRPLAALPGSDAGRWAWHDQMRIEQRRPRKFNPY